MTVRTAAADRFAGTFGQHRGGTAPADALDTAEPTERAWARTQRLRQDVYMGRPAGALSELAAHAGRVDSSPALTTLAGVLAQRVCDNFAVTRRTYIVALARACGCLQDARHAGLTANPQAPLLAEDRWGHVRDAVRDRICAGDLLRGLDAGAFEEKAVYRAAAPIIESELKLALAEQVAENPGRALRWMFGRDFQALCDALGWEEPAELLDDPAVCADLVGCVSAAPEHLRGIEAQRFMERRADAWAREHLGS